MAFRSSGLAFTKCTRMPGRTKRRPWTAKAVGRVACYAAEDGVSQDDLLEALEKCAPCKGKRANKREDQATEECVAESSSVMAQAIQVLLALEIAIGALMLLSRFVPILRPVQIPARIALAPVAALVVRLRSARAANDAVYRMIQLRKVA